MKSASGSSRSITTIKPKTNEHEAAMNAEGQTVIAVPTELVPEIVKHINKKRRT
jgi:hypothetical protein